MRRQRFRSEPLAALTSLSQLGLALGLALGLTACGDAPRADGYGLTLVELSLTTEAIAGLRQGAYTETPVACRAEIDGARGRCQIRTAGSTTRDDLKKNFDLEFPHEYAGRRRHRLSAMSGDPSGLRTLLASSSFALAGLEGPEVEPVALWLNDEYLGLYLLLEPIDEEFFRARDDRAIALYKARNLRASLEATHDLQSAFAERAGEANRSDLRALVENIDQATRGAPHRLEELVDVAQVLRYMAGAHFIHNWDGIDNNYFLARSAREPRFRIVAWDLDQTFGSVLDPTGGELFERNALFRLLYAARQPAYLGQLQRLNQLVTPEVVARLVQAFESAIREAYEHDPFLRGKPLAEQADAIERRAEQQHAAISEL